MEREDQDEGRAFAAPLGMILTPAGRALERVTFCRQCFGELIYLNGKPMCGTCGLQADAKLTPALPVLLSPEQLEIRTLEHRVAVAEKGREVALARVAALERSRRKERA